MKKYLYNGVKYPTELKVREAIFKNTRKAFNKMPVNANEVEFWAKHNVEIVEEDADSLDHMKLMKSVELKQTFLRWRSNQATLVSSLGFTINANERAKSDIQDLIDLHEGAQTENIEFRCADNTFRTVTLNDLNTMRLEIIENNTFAYQQKWKLEESIAAAENSEQLKSVNIAFEGKNFVKRG